MSASLVGSEMCIRDRALSARPPQRVQRHSVGLEGAAWGTPPKERTVKGPVSYTHLTLPTICSV
eukprot:5082899-Alexandrium_andersonii.AAC.1